MYKEEDIKKANKTNRGKGAVGSKAIVPAHVIKCYGDLEDKHKPKVLDFGAGKDALHTKTLREKGFIVTAYEFGENRNDNHDPKALDGVYDVIIASNVLNVQQSKDMLHWTIRDIKKAMRKNPDTVLYMNYPKSPRYIGFTDQEMGEWLCPYFRVVNRNVKTGLFTLKV